MHLQEITIHELANFEIDNDNEIFSLEFEGTNYSGNNVEELVLTLRNNGIDASNIEEEMEEIFEHILNNII